MASQSQAVYRRTLFFSQLSPPFSLAPRKKVQKKSMDASTCFLPSKPFNKTLNPTPQFKTRICSPLKKSYGRCLHRLAAAPSPNITICNVQHPPPEDEATIKSDWRSFRARLVARESASSTSSDRTEEEAAAAASIQAAPGEKWAHPISEAERGCLLIATEKLDGVHIFERTVILLISIAPLGPTGVILNRPSLMSIKETKSTLFDVAGTFSDRPLFFGGPLEEGIFLVSPGNCEDGVGRSGVFEEVMKGLYYGTKESVGCAAEMVKRNVLGVGDFRFFDGYCGWENDQLREEIRGGYWNVVACSLSVIGITSAGLWEEVMGLVRERKLW